MTGGTGHKYQGVDQSERLKPHSAPVSFPLFLAARTCVTNRVVENMVHPKFLEGLKNLRKQDQVGTEVAAL